MQGILSRGILSRGILSLLIFGNHKIWGILSEGILSQGNFYLRFFVKGGFCNGGGRGYRSVVECPTFCRMGKGLKFEAHLF